MLKRIALAAILSAPLALGLAATASADVTEDVTVTGNQTVVGNGNSVDQSFKKIANGSIFYHGGRGDVSKSVTVTGNQTIDGDFNDVSQKFKNIANGDIKAGHPFHRPLLLRRGG